MSGLITQHALLTSAGAAQLSWTATARGTSRDMEVAAVLVPWWPEIEVALHWPGSPVRVHGIFSATGRLRAVRFEAVSDKDSVTTAGQRLPGLLLALREWEAVSRRAATQILAGHPLEGGLLDARTPARALGILARQERRHSRRPRQRMRAGDREKLIRQVAAAYKEEVAAGNSRPRVVLAERFGYTPQHIASLVMAARKPRDGQSPLLGPAHPGRAGERPARVPA